MILYIIYNQKLFLYKISSSSEVPEESETETESEDETKVHADLTDTDGDGVGDSKEIELGLNPNNQFSNNDGVLDGDRIFEINKTVDNKDDLLVYPLVEIELRGDQVDSLDIRVIDEDYVLLNKNIPGFVSNAFEFTANDSFEEADVSFEVDESLDIDKLALYYWNEENQLFEIVEDQYIENKKICAKIHHFSKYSVMDKDVYENYISFFTSYNDNIDITSEEPILLYTLMDYPQNLTRAEYQKMYSINSDLVNYLRFDENCRVEVCKMYYYYDTYNSKLSNTSAVGSTFDKSNHDDDLQDFLMPYNNFYHKEGIPFIDYLYYDYWLKFYNIEFPPYKEYKKYFIIFTGPEWYTGEAGLNELADTYKDSGVELIIVGVDGCDEEALGKFATTLGGKYININNEDEISRTVDEIKKFESTRRDSDKDGISDYFEKKITSGELKCGNGLRMDNFSSMDYNNSDSDGDGLLDGEEIEIRKSPLGDGYYIYLISNPCKANTDNDEFSDYEEEYMGTNKLSKLDFDKNGNYINSYGKQEVNENQKNRMSTPGFPLLNLYDWIQLRERGHAFSYVHNAVEKKNC